MSSPIKLVELTKFYGPLRALDGVNLEMKRGEILGLLGPNGAGKTTLISILTTLETPTSGEAYVFGEAVDPSHRRVKASIGVVPQEVMSHGFFSVEEILKFHSGYYGIRENQKQIDFLLSRLGLDAHRKKRVRQLSGGMKRRFLIAKALVHSPKLLLLDEPTAGVDIELRNTLWEFVKELNQQGTSVLLTTHNLEEAQHLCQRVAIINHGKLLRLGDTYSLIRQLTMREVTIEITDPTIPVAHPTLVQREGSRVVFRLKSDFALGSLLRDLNLSSSQINDFKIEEGNLEDAFLHVIWEK